MNIYVDFDDVLCETARNLSGLCARLFGRPVVPYEDIRAFNLRESFHLTDAEHSALMLAAHTGAEILAYEPTPGAAETLRAWQAAGLATTIVTGRPPSTRAAATEWLRKNNFPELPIIFLDKYNRHTKFPDETTPPLTLEEFDKLHFDIAIEDAPAAVELLLQRRPDCRVIVFARPWNSSISPTLTRLAGWPEIAKAVAAGNAL